ncbi:MAG: efflux RND transporter periplasmic adaptor subunit [Thermoanaerobacteraceae bacterium]|nr:efflux RND transporter periplasmic adaptor subunit [Thermoanaerobacteraceae bacterium]
MSKRYPVIIVSIIMILTIVLGGCGTTKNTSSVPEEQVVTVSTIKATTGDISEFSNLVGTLKPNEMVNVVPKMPGKVVSVNFDVGDRVNAGDVLFRIDDTDIQNQVKSAEAALNMAEANYTLNKQKYEQSQADFARYEALYKEGAISQQQYEQTKLSVSPDMLKLYEAQLEQAQAAYNTAKTQLDNTVVTSPITGVVASKNINVGEMAASTMPSFVIVDNSSMFVEVNLTDSLINRVKPGDKVTVRIREAEGQAVEGIVDTVAPAADQRTGLFPAKIKIDNKDGSLKAGMTATVVLPSETKNGVVIVPKEAVVIQNTVSVVFTVKDGKSVRNVVTTGISDDKNIEIVSGIKAGDEVIVKGQNLLSGGEKLKIENGGSK